jgi:lantibiotic transport system permease protein
MSLLLRVLSAEVLKLRRTWALRLAIIAPLFIVVLVFGVYMQRAATVSAGVNPLTGFAQLVLTMWTILLFPWYVALAASLLAAIEHQDNNWAHMLALPIRRASLFHAKWIAAIGLVLVSALLLPGFVSVAAAVLRVVKPAWRESPLPIAMIFRGSLLSFLAAGLLCSIQMWVSLRWRSFVAGLGVAVVATMGMLVVVPRAGAESLIGATFPWSLPAVAMAPNSPHRALAITWGFAGGIACGAIACWHLSRRDV